MKPKTYTLYPLSAWGYQAFWALAGLSALGLIALWNMLMQGTVHLQNYFPAAWWHAHEMLLGFGAAVIASLVLALLRDTILEPQSILKLIMTWIYGRIVPFYAGLLPNELIASIDLLFLPLLAYFSRKLLWQTNHSSRLCWLSLLLLASANLAIHAEILGWAEHTATIGIKTILAVLVMVVIVFAGPVLPGLTERALSGVICMRNPLLDIAAIALAAIFWLAILIGAPVYLVVILAILAALSNVIRMWNWVDSRICYVPLLWILYSGYIWIILGFLLFGLAAMSELPDNLAIHAFAVGSIGILSLGMMARLMIGYPGQSMRRGNALAISFLLINLVALLLAIFPAVFPNGSAAALLIAAYAWLASFSVLIAYFLATESAS